MLRVLANGTFKKVAEQVLDMLSHVISTGTLFVAVHDTQTNSIVCVRSRGEALVAQGSVPFLHTYCSLILSQPANQLTIANTQTHPLTAAMSITRVVGEAAFTGVSITLEDGRGVGSVCYLDRECHTLTQRQVDLMQTAAKSFACVIGLETASYTDPVTQTFNGRYLEELLQRWAGQYPMVAAFVLDLDHLKFFARVEGFAFRKGVANAVAERIRRTLHTEDVLAKTTDNEFVVLSHRVSSDDDVLRIGEEILNSFRLPLTMLSRQLMASPRIGIAVYPDPAADLTELINHAAVALYASAQPGTRINLYQAKNTTLMRRRLHLENLFATALQNQEFEVHYQPKFQIQNDNAFCSVEALLRWRRSDGEWISPNEFIPIAESTGFIEPLGKWVLHKACQQNREWQRMGYKPIVVSVNISPKQFAAGYVFGMVTDALLDTGLAPEWLAIEITEGCLMQNPLEIAGELKRIREFGVKVAIDDFGTGYSSLSYLCRFKPTHLKIDQFFIGNMLDDVSSMAIVNATISLAHSLGMTVVAEGVETPEQLEVLRAGGCDLVQGFLLSKPLPARDVQRVFETDGLLPVTY